MTILETILAGKADEVARLPKVSLPTLCTRDFSNLFPADGPAIFAEVKAASPTAGVLTRDFNPAAIAREYVLGGANAISVLTDAGHFKGSYHDLGAVSAAVPHTPVLCKDFIVDEKQVMLARANGADMCLLIARILDPLRLRDLKNVIEGLRMKAVIEITSEAELDMALKVGAGIVLINNRDLDTFELDKGQAACLSHLVPPEVKIIAASGYDTPDEVWTSPVPFDGFLIGSALMKTGDKAGFIRACRP